MEQTGILTKILSKNIDLSYLEKGVGPTIIFLHGMWQQRNLGSTAQNFQQTIQNN